MSPPSVPKNKRGWTRKIKSKAGSLKKNPKSVKWDVTEDSTLITSALTFEESEEDKELWINDLVINSD